MESRHHTHRIPLSIVVAGLSAVVVIAGGSTAWWTWHSLTSVESTPTVTSPSTTDSTANTPDTPIAAVEQTVELYWLEDTGQGLVLSPYTINIQGEDQPEELLATAFDALLTGPDSTTVFSTIPPGTRLLDLQVEPDGIHVDLSNEFGLGGGSAAMSGRLAQVLYTATALDENAPVWISVDGQPLKVLGGEGLVVEQPMTRSDFEREFQL